MGDNTNSDVRLRRRSSSEGRVGSERRNSKSNNTLFKDLIIQTLQRNGNNEQTNTSKSVDSTSQSQTVVDRTCEYGRSCSTGSSDSFDSDSQLCTPDHCVMDRKRKTVRDSGDGNESKEYIYLLNKGERPNQLNSNSLCKYCGGEMQKNPSSEVQSVKKSGLLLRTVDYLEYMLGSVAPRWWTEPEFMVHPKPRINKNIVHHHTDSLLSTSSGFTNYYGFLNLCLILLVLSNARLFLENIIKYGVLVDFSFTKWLFSDPYNWPNLLLTMSLVIYPAIALVTEKFLAQSIISNTVGFCCYLVNLGMLLIVPATVIYTSHPIVLFSLFSLGCTTLSFLKLFSYGHTNYWYRELRASSANKHKRRRSYSSPGDDVAKSPSPTKEVQTYPENLNVNDVAYFMFAPTLCYELNFPRSARIRKRFLVKRALELAFLVWLSVCFVQQWIVPTVNNAKQPLAEMEVFKMLERLLKLSIPNHFIWLIFFYWFFHSALNIVAELTRFGDREFYKDWWNADSVSQFWQHWNIPVHRFGLRHIYKPMLSKGFNKLQASCTVFFLSAFFHEYLVSVSLRMFKVWAFMGMAAQVPMAYVTAKYIHGKWGNICMWLTVILGQPVAILAYFHDYYIVYALPLDNVNTTSASGLH